MKNLITTLLAGFLIIGLFASPAAAIGVYADIPLNYTIKGDCTQDCSQTPSGMKAGVLWGNIGFGLEDYSMSNAGTTLSIQLLDVSYLLPIPIVNLTLGAGIGGSQLEIAGFPTYDGTASQVWASFGFPIIPLFDLHLGYHMVNTKLDVGGTSVDLSGNMLSFGAMFNF